MQKLIIILVFEKLVIFSQKIGENCDYNIDPRLGENSFTLSSFFKITKADLTLVLLLSTKKVMHKF
jgi:hypothetical protein